MSIIKKFSRTNIIWFAVGLLVVVANIVQQTIKFFGNETSKVVYVLGLLLILVPFIEKLFKSKEKPAPINLDILTATKLADAKLVEERELMKKTIEELQQQLSGRKTPKWKQHLRSLLQKGEIDQALESLDTDEADVDAAERHLAKARLYVLKLNFTDAAHEYVAATTIHSSYANNYEFANFHHKLNHLSLASEYYLRALSLASSSEEKASVLNDLARVQNEMGDYDKAQTSYSEALTMANELAERYPDKYYPFKATIYNNMGAMQRTTGDMVGAMASYNKALKIRKRLAARDPEKYNFDIAQTLYNLGNLQLQSMNFSEAEVSLSKALEIRRRLAEENPDYRSDLAHTLNSFGSVQRYTGDFAGAKASWDEAVDLWKNLAVENPQAYLPCLAMTYVNITMYCQKDLHNIESAVQFASEAKRILSYCNPTPFVQQMFQKVDRVLEQVEK